MATSKQRDEARPPSRYEKVRQVLDAVQGGQVPAYDGHGAFWRDYDLLMKVSLYGRRMIAPLPEGDLAPKGGSCCHPAPTALAAEPVPSEAAQGKPPADDDPAHRAVAMFSPYEDPDAGCFPTGGDDDCGCGDEGGRGTTRSDRSGLIAGLRGQPPFDGSVFPPLLWNAARRATDAEIAFVAAWIDDGCPRTDAGDARKTAAVRTDARLALAQGDAAHPRAQGNVNAHREAVAALKIRKDVDCLDEEDLKRLRAAITCLSTYDGYWLDERSYDYWARIHTNSCQHGWEQFLPWHRLYLYFFEKHLQDIDSQITLPYWSWSAYADQNNLETTQLDTGVLPPAYRCWIDDATVEQLAALETAAGAPLFSKGEVEGMRHIAGQRMNSGPRFLKAAGIHYAVDDATGAPRWTAKVRAVYDALIRLNPLWFPNRWPGTAGAPAHYPTPDDIDHILATPTFPAFGGGPGDDHHFGVLEEVHNGMHNFSGGLNPGYTPGTDQQALENPQYGYMTENRTTAFDPIFWAHHANVDRLWARWQTLHPGAGPEALDGSLPPWPLAVRDALSTRKLGYEYVKDAHFYPTHPGRAMVRFRSAPAPVPPPVRATFRHAEVRLHRVRRGDVDSGFLRVFLNTPDAAAATPTVGNPNFAAQTATFHTRCYGGPGHCADPLPRQPRHDHRPLHHHEPRNFRLDVTETARRILADGAEDLTVHVVAVGLDGKPGQDVLYLDGVSLNFID